MVNNNVAINFQEMRYCNAAVIQYRAIGSGQSVLTTAAKSRWLQKLLWQENAAMNMKLDIYTYTYYKAGPSGRAV